MLPPPAWLTDAQKASWDRAVENLPRALQQGVDVALLTIWVIAEERYRVAAIQQAEIDKKAALPLMTKGAGNRSVPSPYIAHMDRAAQEMRRAAAALGFRPSAGPSAGVDPSANAYGDPALGRAGDPEAAGEDADLEMGELDAVSKRELCLILRISRTTLDAWIDKYGEAFPVVEHGTHGRGYRFDPQAVVAFLRSQQDEQNARKAERDEQLAQLVLRFEDEVSPAASQPGVGASLAEQLQAEKLNDSRLARAVRMRQLVRASEVTDLSREMLAGINQGLQVFVGQLAREHGWPAPIRSAAEDRLRELQDRLVAEARMKLRGEPSSDDAPEEEPPRALAV